MNGTGEVVTSRSPRTGEVVETGYREDDRSAVDLVCRRAADAVDGLRRMRRGGRAALLRGAAEHVERSADQLIMVADRETALGRPRLSGELARTCFQLRFMADLLEEGSYLEATVDHATESPMGPLPDLRRIMRPVGAVGVFAASNFPFAFSVAGGDTASALAAGCPVVVKAHEGHPETSRLQIEALQAAARDAGAPEGTVAIIFGRQAGLDLVLNPAISAVGFTGSLAAGRMLFDLASSRPTPIPFYGELGALNAMVVTQAAAVERADEIASGVTGSFTLGNGQFCTKPGLLLLPDSVEGRSIRDRIGRLVDALAPAPVLTPKTADGFTSGTDVRLGLPGVHQIGRAAASSEPGLRAGALAVEAPLTALSGELLEECFGPLLVVSTYADQAELAGLLSRLTPALTFSVLDDPDGQGLDPEVLDLMLAKVGRVVWNGFPTGVAVSWAMQHGGPYPATTAAAHTSVGGAAVRRWLRPVTFQNFPQHLLPAELREEDPGVPRRVDGVLLPAPADAERGTVR